MDLWRGSLVEFVRTTDSGELPGLLTGQFVNIYRRAPSSGEIVSWDNSLPHLAAALRDFGGTDIGVIIDAGHCLPAGALRAADGAGAASTGIGVSAEYHLPLSGQRVDVLLCGRGRDGRERAVVLELKQWSSAELENGFSRNVRVDGIEHAHPCEQARDCARWTWRISTATPSTGANTRKAPFGARTSHAGSSRSRCSPSNPFSGGRGQCEILPRLPAGHEFHPLLPGVHDPPRRRAASLPVGNGEGPPPHGGEGNFV